ncbi:uncharacterized protein LOC129908493 [Episyrphus balteatus]|uniref:uncharacterized protein LOC129908493 n=1 Tax=Episyrphus balteatus TaxID=286459 RepID=UPI0024861E23|nr:uncharacterized protein LOC129908493 [Episyrphus balteatus]
MHYSWLKYREGLQSLNNIRIDRHVFAHRIYKDVQFHVFADASEKAYGAAVYVRSVSNDNIVTVRLLCAKSRVAPSKQSRQQATIPRLELCGAYLATDLLLRLQKDLEISTQKTFLWTDSEIVLAWINSSSSANLPIFVANRVSHIQQNTTPQQWHHVPSRENPADVLSRGIAPEKLQDCHIWFYGPKFLHGPVSNWPPAYKPAVVNHLSAAIAIPDPPPPEDILMCINHKNSFKKAERLVAYILRYKHNLKQKALIARLERNKDKLSAQELLNKLAEIKLWSGPLTVAEINNAKKAILKKMQQNKFKEEFKILRNGAELPKHNQFNSLTPFLDEEGLIRVGGRLEASSLPYDAKHPILIPHDHPFSKLLLASIHEDNNHVGPQTLLSIARQSVWPVKGKMLARSIFHKCVQCARASPKLLTQQIGNLPTHRIQPARPFINTGVDFCGPVSTHYKIRGKKPQKSYIAIFCCFSTKACHLELVTDLTAQGFIGALKRFMAKRGHCRNIYCDNATNFVGAKNQLLSELMAFLESPKEREKISSSCVTKGCDFHFIPPRSPHFGGLWEAAVKSSKHLLQHTLAGASLTYEELETVATQVEAILNSRPITPMSTSPNDLTALTPGHFLIGEPLVNNVDPAAVPNNTGLLARWNLVNHLKNEFWRRWSRDYLNQLQHRYRWKERCENAEPGMMVLIKEDNTSSLKWPIGRITNVITGNDGLVRVADVRTANGTFRRAIHRLAPLPVSIPDEERETEDNTARCSSNSARSSNKPEDDPVPKKRFKPTIASTTLAILLAFIFIPMMACNPVKIQPFQSQPGIYFENFGTSALTSSNWNIVAYYDMDPYWTEYNSI